MANLKAIPGGQVKAVTNAVDHYPFTAEFERAVAAMLSSNRDFYSRIGAHLDPKALTAPEAVNLFKASKAIAEETGEGPTTAISVIQRLRAWREDGKITHEQVLAAVEYLDAAEDAGLPDVEETINEVSKILIKRAKKVLAQKTIEATVKDGNLSSVAEYAQQIDRIGKSRQTVGERIHADVFYAIHAEGKTDKLPTGCYELDTLLGGGLPPGYTLFLGREKSGKSMVLSSLAAETLWRGGNVAVATLELSVLKQMERIIANLIGLPMRTVQGDPDLAKSRYLQIQDYVGQLRVAHFSPDTPVSEVTSWAEQVKREMGGLSLLVVDYADLLGDGKSGKDSNDYKVAKTVGNTLRDHALEHGYKAASATQGKRGSGTGKPLDMDDGADSQHKVRIADLVIAMRMEMDQKDMVDWYIILKRDGGDRIGTGALPTNREAGRMFPVQRDEPWGQNETRW